ncbi:hypothetical protein [Levilactobacillus spicheri]|nr:hypothetical protein [Levilactobacillus spicheri]
MLPKIPGTEYVDYRSNHFATGLLPQPTELNNVGNHGADQELTTSVVTTAANPDIKIAQLINTTIKGLEDPKTGDLTTSDSPDHSVADDFKVFAYLGDLQSQSLFKAGYDENGYPKLTVNKNTPSGRYTLIVVPKSITSPYASYFYSANITFTLDNQMNPRPVTPPTPVDPENPDIPTPPTTPTVPVTPAPQPSDPTPGQSIQPAPSQPTPQPQTAGQGDHGTTTTKPGRPAGQGAIITPQRPRPTNPRAQRSRPRTVALRRTSRPATALTRSSCAPQSAAQLPQTDESTTHRLQLISLGLLTLTGALIWRKRF